MPNAASTSSTALVGRCYTGRCLRPMAIPASIIVIETREEAFVPFLVPGVVLRWGHLNQGMVPQGGQSESGRRARRKPAYESLRGANQYERTGATLTWPWTELNKGGGSRWLVTGDDCQGQGASN